MYDFALCRRGAALAVSVLLDGESARVDDFWERCTTDLRADPAYVRERLAAVGEAGRAWNRKVERLRAEGVADDDLHLHYDQPLLKVCGPQPARKSLLSCCPLQRLLGTLQWKRCAQPAPFLARAASDQSRLHRLLAEGGMVTWTQASLRAAFVAWPAARAGKT